MSTNKIPQNENVSSIALFFVLVIIPGRERKAQFLVG